MSDFLVIKSNHCVRYVYIHTISNVIIHKNTDSETKLAYPWKATIEYGPNRVWSYRAKTMERCKRKLESILLDSRGSRLQVERDFAVKLLTDRIRSRCEELLEDAPPPAKRRRTLERKAKTVALENIHR